MAAASRIRPLSLTSSRAAMASAPPTEDAALLPIPLPGFMPFAIVIEKPRSSHPHDSASLIAAYEAVFSIGSVGTVFFPLTLTSNDPDFAFLKVTRSLGESRHRPNESKPGPKLAIVAGDETTALAYLISSSWQGIRRMDNKPIEVGCGRSV